MENLRVSIGIIEQGGEYFLQRRGNNPVIGAAGLIGAFGGKIEPNEKPIEAVCREIAEETSLTPEMDDFIYLGNVEVISDIRNLPIKIDAHVYQLTIDLDLEVIAREGEVVRLTAIEVLERSELLTPATKAAFEQFINGV